MKGLGQFRRFDWDGFSRDKIFQVVAIAERSGNWEKTWQED